MKREDAEEYTQALGQVVAGGWRQIALGQRLGVPKALGLSVDEWVKQRLGGYVRLSVEERHGAVKELKADGHTEREIASVLGVSPATVHSDIVAQNQAGDISKDSEKLLPPAQNQAPIDAMAALAATEEVIEAAKREEKRKDLDDRRAKLRAGREVRPFPAGKFRLIYGDPPWRYEHVETESRAIENQYPTLSLEEIINFQDSTGRKIQDLPADDCVLFLWATSPKLAEAMRVIEAWGFNYRTCAVWDKGKIGMGYYFRQQHELLLVAGRGDLPVPEPSARVPSVIKVTRPGIHSRKPVQVIEILESMYPTFGKKDRIELFSREERVGWSVHGNEPEAVSA